MNDRTSSLPYWNERWAKTPGHEASWPDYGCRVLELALIRKFIERLPRDQKILEIGCGAFQLSEDPYLWMLLKDRYIGVDGSPVAIKQARKRGPKDGFRFHLLDLTTPDGLEKLSPPSKTILISKRTIQNIAPETRKHLWPYLKAYRGGLLIEDFAPFRFNTNEHRRNMNKPPLAVPEFNWPIELTEPVQTFPNIHFYAFMGYYMQVTRCQGEIPDDIRIAALRLSQWAIETDRGQPSYGPVVAMVFGERPHGR